MSYLQKLTWKSDSFPIKHYMKSLECLEFGVPRVFKGSGVNQVNLTMIYQAWYKESIRMVAKKINPCWVITISNKNITTINSHYIS